MEIKLEVNIHDFWIGVYWESTLNQWKNKAEERLDIWICIIPCIPIHIIKRKTLREYPELNELHEVM